MNPDLDLLSISPQDAARQIELLEEFCEGLQDFFDKKTRSRHSSKLFAVTFPLHRGENPNRIISTIYEALAAPTKRLADDLIELEGSSVFKQSKKSLTLLFHERVAPLRIFVPGYIEQLRPIAAAHNAQHAATEALLDLAEGKTGISQYDLPNKIRDLLARGADTTATRDGITLRDLAGDHPDFLKCLDNAAAERIRPLLRPTKRNSPDIQR